MRQIADLADLMTNGVTAERFHGVRAAHVTPEDEDVAESLTGAVSTRDKAPARRIAA